MKVDTSATTPRGNSPTALPIADETARASRDVLLPPIQAEPVGMGRDHRLTTMIDGLDLEAFQRAYLHERWLGQLHYLGQSARRAQRRYYGLRLMAILGGVTIPALIGLIVNGDPEPLVHWLAFSLGLLVAAAVALEEFFRFGDRWRHFRQQSELLRSEGWSYIERAGPVYRRYGSHAEAFGAFVGRVEQTLREEIGIYIDEVARPSEDPRSLTPPIG